MNLTVGYIEDILRKFPKETPVNVSCNHCNLGSQGSTDIIKIVDNTKQTFGYVNFVLNDSAPTELKVSDDEKKYYENVIKRYGDEIKKLQLQLNWYKSEINNIKSSAERAIKFGGN